ncbi:hypothetical protein EV384_1653 [Micromonospora kangleipakensis]|uniref:PPE family protein n=2 Tax=Micromonospora kangleipakensis TaxID=1077942 RepID=A0A4Q8B6I4_9ACTN|nr:hypothetical protein EV384_1653 [Micromonospora kangleipakensis]
MWACLQDHDTAGHWKQVAGWRKVCDLALAHLSRLREYRRGLAAAWPPETNAAARAYIGELDQLIDKVQHTHDAAAANYDALAAATRAIGSTRAELEPLYQEYATKLQQKQAYEATVADPKAVAGSRLPEQPPVTDADLERLNVKGRGLMTGLSGELQQAQVMLRTPPPAPKLPRQTEDPDVYGNSGPIIPPIVPVPISTSGSVAAVSRPSTAARPVHTPAASNVGPVLGAAGSRLAPAPTNPGPNGLTPANPATPSPGTALSPTFPTDSGALRRPGVPLGEPSRPVRRPLSGGTNGLPHAAPSPPLPPGGLIGGTPAMGLSQPSGNTSPRRVNPVGGVIGGGGAGTAPTGGAGSRPGSGRAGQFGGVHGAAPIGGSPGLANSPGMGRPTARNEKRKRGEPEARDWDPDDPWETDEGVPPVVRPPDDDGPINPGPAIGFTR